MALNFEIKLSYQCCQLLLALIAYTQDQAKKPIANKMKRLQRWSEFMPKTPHFVTHARILGDNGLISKEDGDWTVTRKGHLMAEVLEMEFTEAKANARYFTRPASVRQLKKGREK